LYSTHFQEERTFNRPFTRALRQKGGGCSGDNSESPVSGTGC
jgi:hypothetical protein